MNPSPTNVSTGLASLVLRRLSRLGGCWILLPCHFREVQAAYSTVADGLAL